MTASGPNADDIAHALVLAAGAHGEVGLLRECGEAMLMNRVACRWRWIALAALVAVWGQRRTLRAMPFAERWGGDQTASQYLARMRRQTWWDRRLVDHIAAVVMWRSGQA